MSYLRQTIHEIVQEQYIPLMRIEILKKIF